jgi:hypothetical protein
MARLFFLMFAATLLMSCSQRMQKEYHTQDPVEAYALMSKLTTLETLFADLKSRALYHASVMPPFIPGCTMGTVSTPKYHFSYLFSLKLQPGMINKRHFQNIVVSWASPGTFIGANGKTNIGMSGGPSSSFYGDAVRTADGRYEIGVTLQMSSLPNSVQTAEVDTKRIARVIVERYDQALR